MAIQLRFSCPVLLAASIAAGVSSAFAAPVHRTIVTRVPPAYPELARRMHVAGKVVLLVTVKPDGSVSGTKVESGHALLVPAAQDAVSRWRFTPDSDTSESEVEVNFTLDPQ